MDEEEADKQVAMAKTKPRPAPTGSSLTALASSVLRWRPRAQGGGAGAAAMADLFAKTDPATDGPECGGDCSSCTLTYPAGFKIDQDDSLYGGITGWATHLLVATGKTDWLRDVADEKGSVMEAVAKMEMPATGRLMLSASDMPAPSGPGQYADPTTVLLLPAFVRVANVHPTNVPLLMEAVVGRAATSTSPLSELRLPARIESPDRALPPLTTSRCPHAAVILMCSQRTRDVRCGQSAPLLRREFERHLRPLGLLRDPDDERPGGVAIHFISHVGGHKYSANVIIYRRPNAFSLDPVAGNDGDENNNNDDDDDDGNRPRSDSADVGASQCIWLARVRPEDCENLVRYTVLRGKVVKPERQLRGGFDRAKGLTSW